MTEKTNGFQYVPNLKATNVQFVGHEPVEADMHVHAFYMIDGVLQNHKQHIVPGEMLKPDRISINRFGRMIFWFSRVEKNAAAINELFGFQVRDLFDAAPSLKGVTPQFLEDLDDNNAAVIGSRLKVIDAINEALEGAILKDIEAKMAAEEAKRVEQYEAADDTGIF